eukprot:9094410-Pyramimonas_sp.AAC.1
MMSYLMDGPLVCTSRAFVPVYFVDVYAAIRGHLFAIARGDDLRAPARPRPCSATMSAKLFIGEF